MRDLQRDAAFSAPEQTAECVQSSLKQLSLLETLAKVQQENEALHARVVFLTKQIEELRSLSRPAEFDYEKLADKVFERVQASVPVPRLHQLDQIEDLLQMLEDMKVADTNAAHRESASDAQSPSHEIEVSDQLQAIREQIQKLSVARS
jgi:transcriptional regulator of heat shock response